MVGGPGRCLGGWAAGGRAERAPRIRLSAPQLAPSMLRAIPRATTLVILTDPSTPPSVGAKIVAQAAASGLNAVLRPLDALTRPQIHVIDRLGLPDDHDLDRTLRSMGVPN